MPTHLRFLALTTLAFALMASPAYAVSATCENVFRESASSAPAPAKTERQRLIDLATKYYATPIADRGDFRHPAFTDISKTLIEKLEATYSETQKSVLSRGLWFSRRKTQLRVARAYLDLVQQYVKRKTQDGDMTALGAIQMGHHAAWLFDLIGDHFTIRHITAPLAETTAKEFFADNASASRRDFFPQLAAIPTTKWYSYEGVIELMAHGMRIYGIYTVTPEGRDSRNYRIHDHTHALDWIEELLQAVDGSYFQKAESSKTRLSYSATTELRDLVTSTSYQRIHWRLQTIVERLKRYPAAEREAAFAFAFYLFHEQPKAYLRLLAQPTRLTPAQFLDPDRKNGFFAKRMSDPEDLGLAFRQKIANGVRIVIDSELNTNRAYKTFFEAIEGL